MTRVDIHASVRQGDNMQIMGDLSLARGVEVGANVSFYPNVHVGENTKILPGAVIGRPPIRAGTTNRPIDRGDATLRIGSDCVIGANCVLYTNMRIGNNVLIGDLACIREGGQLEDDTVVGRASILLHDIVLQARSRVHDMVHLTGNMLIESDVFIGPSVSAANDNDVYLKRFGLDPLRKRPPSCPALCRHWHGCDHWRRCRSRQGRYRGARRDGDQRCRALDHRSRRAGARTEIC